jgi:predicted small lipoprotein YifL
MNHHWEIRAALTLILILVVLSLQACGQVPMVDKVIEQHEAEHTVEDAKESSLPNFQGIADALGCVFAPQSCKK